VLRAVPDLPPPASASRAEAAARAEAYRCPACGARAQVTGTVTVKHGLLCPVAARILEMRIGAA